MKSSNIVKKAATMVPPCNCSPLRLAVLSIVLHGIGKISVGGSNSCETSKSTVEVVDDCPHSEEKWRKAAARKNCSAYANQCDDPSKLVYHCIINEYVTQTLEVCAYTQYIFLGQCTSYSISGNLIQQNSRTNCADFTENPCPSDFYNSDEAYKYPGCYQLTRKTTVTENPMSKEYRDTPSTTRSNLSAKTTLNMLEKEEKKEMNIVTLAIIIVLGVLLFLCVVIAVCCWKRLRRKPQNINIPTEQEMDPLNETEKQYR